MSETLDFLREIHEADRLVMERIQEVIPDIGLAADAIAANIQAGGRCFYIGAGTSGRLGALDAAELPPTFGLPRDKVIALMAGGNKALLNSIEDAEDDSAVSAKDLNSAGLGAGDAVVGIAASGTTPYVLGAIQHAKQVGALTVALVCNPGTPISEAADLAIAVHTGPEILSGSTRMKAGTAQKLVLTMLSTAMMNRLGLIYDSEMVAMRPTNAKLRARAMRIVRDLTEIENEDAKQLLESSDWDLPIALIRGRFGLSVADAKKRLGSRHGSVAAALTPDEPLTD